MRISDWSSDVCSSDLLILKIPRDMLESDDVAPIAPLATLPAGLDAQWLLLVQVLLGASSAPTCAGESAAWVEHIEQGLASLLRAASSCSLPRESSDRNFVARDPIARLQAMEDYMRERLRSEERRVGKECVSTCKTR